MSSAAVSFRAVHRWVAAYLQAAGNWPMVGTVEWCQLDDSDPRKLAAVLDAAQHWALRVEGCQLAAAQASQAISAAADWSEIATQTQRRAELYAERPWLKRTTA